MPDINPDERYILVPISVEALLVGKPVGQWADFHPDFSLLYEGRILGSQVAPAFFNVQSELHKPGIHLHWTLPQALAEGRQSRSKAHDNNPHANANQTAPLSAPEFPLIPNRWMVQRICRKSSTTEVSVRAWVVESDYLHNTKTRIGKRDSVTFPRVDAYALFDYVGEKFDYKKWDEKQQSFRIDLSAVGYGDPAFAAYYPACRSVLGFHDPLIDVGNGTMLAYLVAGWYSDPAKDILRFYSMPDLKWVCSTEVGPLPKRILCHGTVYGLQWKGDNYPYVSAVQSIDKNRCKVACGNNTTEALAALLSEELDNKTIEPLVAAFQEDLLAPNSDLLELDSSLHRHRFGSVNGGRSFAIQKKQANANQAPSATDVTLPESLETSLAELNSEERDYSHKRRKLDGDRWELYAIWQKWCSQYGLGKETSEIETALETLRRNVTSQEETSRSEKGDLDKKEQAVRSVVQQQFADLDFVTSLADPFWRATDPVVLISLDDRSSAQVGAEHRRYSGVDKLPCRITGEEIISLTVDIPNGERGVTVRANEVFPRIHGDPFGGGGPVPKGITDALLLEALLLDPANADAIAEQAYLNAKLPTRLQKDELIRQINKLQRPEGTHEGSGRHGGFLPFPVALHDWKGNPWLPLYLEWRIAWYPSYKNPAEALEHWNFSGEQVDFQWQGSFEPSNERDARVYEGRTILSPHAIQHFTERLRKYNSDRYDKELGQIITKLDHMKVLGQALGGLNDAFIMRDQCLQIAPINPAVFKDEKIPARDPIIDAVRGANFLSPAPGKPFLPIRAGHMRIFKLAVAGAFGETMELTDLDRPIRAQSLPTEGRPEFLQFTPRVAQPLRLNFDWASTPNPPGTYPTNSPVCGWVIPNHLDNNLTFYDGSGRPLGALQKILRVAGESGHGGRRKSDIRAFFWVPMPGTNFRPEEIHNPHLKEFVRWLRDIDADTGNAFWNLLDEALARTDPGQPEDDPTLALLLGRPLALVRAALALELAEPPATDQGMDSIGKFDTKNFTRIKFPVLLGEAQKDTDGLIGYFTDVPDAKTLGPFYAAAGAEGTTHPGNIEYGHRLTVDCETPIGLTLLMDPRARVHAVTGILPKKAITLPPRVSSASKSAKEAFFQVAPLLSSGGALIMPKPSDDFGKWSWAYRPRVTMWDKVETISTASDRAGFAPLPQQLSEGWLKLLINPLAILNFWVKEGTVSVQAQTNITLGWILLGGEQLTLLAKEESKDDKDSQEINKWSVSPLPGEYTVQVKTNITYILVLHDKAGSRSEKRLTITIADKIAR